MTDFLRISEKFEVMPDKDDDDEAPDPAPVLIPNPKDGENPPGGAGDPKPPPAPPDGVPGLLDLSAVVGRLTALEERTRTNDETETRRKSRRDTWKTAQGEASQRREAERKRKGGVRLPWRNDKLRT